eukprot:SAG11_NODE_34324_length_272_cov_1.248555_1_plen_52_part_01
MTVRDVEPNLAPTQKPAVHPRAVHGKRASAPRASITPSQDGVLGYGLGVLSV